MRRTPLGATSAAPEDRRTLEALKCERTYRSVLFSRVSGLASQIPSGVGLYLLEADVGRLTYSKEHAWSLDSLATRDGLIQRPESPVAG